MIKKSALLTIACLWVATGAMSQPTVSVSDQFLAVDGVDSENGAILKIAGPGDYRLWMEIKSGERTTIDLMSVAAAAKAEGVLASELQPGTYHYEIVSRPGGERQGGWFQIGTAGAEDRELRPPPPESVNELDWIQIADDVNDGITVLDLDSDSPEFDFHYSIVNESGLLKFKENNGVSTNGEGTTVISFGRPSQGTGGIGIGVETTLFPLDIQAALPVINLLDTDGGTNWKLINDAGDFALNSTCFTDCELFERWDVVIVEGGSQENSLVIDPTGVSLSSSRTVKKNIRPASSAALLDELAELPIYTWSYAGDGSDTVHVGPMSEDFHQRFGFGSDQKLLSPIDTAGLALAAIQGLRQEVQEKNAKIEAMERRLDALERLIANAQ